MGKFFSLAQAFQRLVGRLSLWASASTWKVGLFQQQATHRVCSMCSDILQVPLSLRTTTTLAVDIVIFVVSGTWFTEKLLYGDIGISPKSVAVPGLDSD